MVEQVSESDTRDDPVEILIAAIVECTPQWLERCVIATATARLGTCEPALAQRAAQMAAEQGPALVDELISLLRTDVDSQRQNPLMLYRSAVVHPTGLLVAAGVPASTRDEFHQRVFAGDRYGLSPATWADIDERLHEPGLYWGAWKAAVILHRRRAEGRR